MRQQECCKAGARVAPSQKKGNGQVMDKALMEVRQLGKGLTLSYGLRMTLDHGKGIKAGVIDAKARQKWSGKGRPKCNGKAVCRQTCHGIELRQTSQVCGQWHRQIMATMQMSTWHWHLVQAKARNWATRFGLTKSRTVTTHVVHMGSGWSLLRCWQEC